MITQISVIAWDDVQVEGIERSNHWHLVADNRNYKALGGKLVISDGAMKGKGQIPGFGCLIE